PGYYEQANPLFKARRDIPLRDGVHTPLGAFFAVGVGSYGPGIDFDVLDLLGLADPLAAHMQRVPPPPGLHRYTGHEKPLPSPWIAARLTSSNSRPNPTDFPNFGVPLIPVTTGVEWQEQVAWARAALRCPHIARIMAAADAPLTP